MGSLLAAGIVEGSEGPIQYVLPVSLFALRCSARGARTRSQVEASGAKPATPELLLQRSQQVKLLNAKSTLKELGHP